MYWRPLGATPRDQWRSLGFGSNPGRGLATTSAPPLRMAEGLWYEGPCGSRRPDFRTAGMGNTHGDHIR